MSQRNRGTTKPLERLYDSQGNPRRDFNRYVKGWLDNSFRIHEHSTPAAFETVRTTYEKAFQTLLTTLSQESRPRWEAHRLMLSGLTDLLSGVDLGTELEERLSSAVSNPNSFRSELSQGLSKNVGENFTNIIVYALADVLIDQDEILVDKELPPHLKRILTLERTFKGTITGSRELDMCIEGDLTIFSRSNPGMAIVVSAKTRLKEVFHIGTMWAVFFDMLDDEYCLEKWRLRRRTAISTKDITYVFATSDQTPEKLEGTKMQGPDIPIDSKVRKLIAMDASFFDYVFVSKQKRFEVANSLNIGNGREALIHELGCLLDLLEQKFLGRAFSDIIKPDTPSTQRDSYQLDWLTPSDGS